MKNTSHRVVLCTLLIAGLLNGMPSYAKRLELQLTKGEPFKAARSQLLSNGWKPRRVKVEGVEYMSIEKACRETAFQR
jgi:hypothetical protein